MGDAEQMRDRIAGALGIDECLPMPRGHVEWTIVVRVDGRTGAHRLRREHDAIAGEFEVRT